MDDTDLEDTVYNDVWCSSDGINWTQVTSNAPWAPRGQIGGQVVFNNKLWILGGGTYKEPRKYYNDIWSTTNGITWTKELSDAYWHPRQYHSMAVFDNKIWVMEGWDGNYNLNDVWYSSDGINWLELKNTPWLERHASSIFNFNSSLLIVAGNLWTDSWRLIDTENPPPPFPADPLVDNSKLTLFPNPFDNKITFYYLTNDITNKWELSIYNELAQLVYHNPSSIMLYGHMTLNTETLQSGVYFIKLKEINSGEVLTKKAIKH